MSWKQKTMQRWGINSAFSFWMIMLAFSLAGSSIVWLRPPIFELLGITISGKPWYQATGIYLLFIFPTYQVMLLVFGTLLGQGRFFWAKEKKMLRGMGRLIGIRPKKQ